LRIVSAGERVLMWRVAKGTKLVHIECADKPHPCGTFRDAAYTQTTYRCGEVHSVTPDGATSDVITTW
jgi:hypothetical protein